MGSTTEAKPIYEVPIDSYYSQHLKSEDVKHLRPFVKKLGDSLSIPSAILAVGSSTFPREHWNYVESLNRENPGLQAAMTYKDIDLLVIPEEITRLAELESSVQEALDSLGYKWYFHEITKFGADYRSGGIIRPGEKNKSSIVEYIQWDYSLHSVSTNLKNGVGLDLILGRDDLLEQTAEQKIADEREQSLAFSLLYRRE